MSDDQTFRLEEYKSLRKEVELYLAESRSQERYTVIAAEAWLDSRSSQCDPELRAFSIVDCGSADVRQTSGRQCLQITVGDRKPTVSSGMTRSAHSALDLLI